MEYFFIQYQHNSKIMLDNISEEFNINRKLLEKFIPQDLSSELKNKINYLSSLDKSIYGQYDGEFIDTTMFMDSLGKKYIIINNRKPQYNNIYDAIEL